MLEVLINRKHFESSGGEKLLAIQQLDFSVGEGCFTCLVGPSGCGKTTILRIILGLETDYEGSVSVGGTGRTATVFQEHRLLPWRSVLQNVELCLPAELREQNLDPLFQELGLAQMQNFFPSELSLGLARRAALARALATEPELLILDEPFVSLDDDTASRLRKLLIDVWSSRPTTVLMVTHNLREAIELADTVLLLSERPSRVLQKITLDEPREIRTSQYIEAQLAQCSAILLKESVAGSVDR